MNWQPEFPVLIIDDEIDDSAAGSAMRAICSAIKRSRTSITASPVSHTPCTGWNSAVGRIAYYASPIR